MHSSYVDYLNDSEPKAVTDEIAANLKDLLTTKQIPLLSSREQLRLADIVECIGMVEKHSRSIDENAGRFLLFFRQHVLSNTHKGPISWREIVWAFHSGSQDILVDLVSRHFNGKMMWQHAKECGVFMWLTDITALVVFPGPWMVRSSLTAYSAHNSRSLPETSTLRPKKRTP